MTNTGITLPGGQKTRDRQENGHRTAGCRWSQRIPYLIELAKRNIEGEIAIDEVRELIGGKPEVVSEVSRTFDSDQSEFRVQ